MHTKLASEIKMSKILKNFKGLAGYAEILENTGYVSALRYGMTV